MYEWSRDGRPSEIPASWLQLLAGQVSGAPSGATSLEKISQGYRNDALTRLAGKLRRDGLTAPEIEAALLTINSQRCDPTLAAAEVKRIARSVGRYSPGEGASGQIKNFEQDLHKFSELAERSLEWLWLCLAVAFPIAETLPHRGRSGSRQKLARRQLHIADFERNEIPRRSSVQDQEFDHSLRRGRSARHDQAQAASGWSKLRAGVLRA